MQEDDPQPHPFPGQALPPWRRAVIKVGSSLLTDGRGELGRHNAAALAGLIARFRDQGREVLLVSSGAVAAGRGLMAQRRGGMIQRQALASLGQTPMLALWQDLIDEPVEQALFVLVGLQFADDPGAGIGKGFIVQVNRVLSGKHQTYAESACLFEHA